jgi:hypothetical protein
MENHRIFRMAFARVYPAYVAKAQRKGRTREEVDRIICWLTGYSPGDLAARLADNTDLQTFFSRAPSPNPDRGLITGTICGIRVEEMPPGTMREIRCLDKLIDELARGRKMDKILRGA